MMAPSIVNARGVRPPELLRDPPVLFLCHALQQCVFFTNYLADPLKPFAMAGIIMLCRILLLQLF